MGREFSFLLRAKPSDSADPCSPTFFRARDVLPSFLLRPFARVLPRSYALARSCRIRMFGSPRLRCPVRSPTPFPFGRYRGIPLLRSDVRIVCSVSSCLSCRRGERFSASALVYMGQNPSRGNYPAASIFKADLLLRPHGGIVHWSVLLLRNLQSLGNESEHGTQHLPLLNFSETYRSPVCVHGRTFLSVILHARGQLPVHRTVLPCLSITFHESYFLFLYLYYSRFFWNVNTFLKNFFENFLVKTLRADNGGEGDLREGDILPGGVLRKRCSSQASAEE